MWVQPSNHVWDPESALWRGRTLYDEFNSTAISFRILNSAWGRVPGLKTDPSFATDPVRGDSAASGLAGRSPESYRKRNAQEELFCLSKAGLVSCDSRKSERHFGKPD
jgi:hypothetical protein